MIDGRDDASELERHRRIHEAVMACEHRLADQGQPSALTAMTWTEPETVIPSVAATTRR